MKTKEFNQRVEELRGLWEAYQLVNGFVRADYDYKAFLYKDEFRLREAAKNIWLACFEYVEVTTLSKGEKRHIYDHFELHASVEPWEYPIEMLKKAVNLIVFKYRLMGKREGWDSEYIKGFLYCLLIALEHIKGFIEAYETMEELSTKEGFRGAIN